MSMTDEQIKQNAEAYILKEYQKVPALTKCAIAGIFAAGAHSRDEEIEELQNELESLRKGFYERGGKLKELMLKNNELRNQWISIEERVPEEDRKKDGSRKYYSQPVFVRYEKI